MADKTNVATLITTNKPATVAASTAAKTGKANIATPVTATMRPNALNPIKETVDAVPAMSALPPNATAVERSAWAANKAQRREAALRAQKEANAKSHTATIPNNNIHAAPVSRKRKAEVSKRDIEPNKRSSRVHSASVRPAAGFNPFHGLPLSEEQKADIEKSKAERLAKFEKAKAKAAAAAHKMFEERQKKYAGPSGHIITPEKKRAHEAKPTKKRKRFQDENEDDADDIDDSVPAPSEGRDEPAHKKRKTNCVARPSGASAAENTEPAQKNSRSVAPKVVAPRRRLSDTSVVHPTYSISNILSEMDAAAANAPVFDRRYDSFVVVTAKPREKADRLEEKAKWAKFHGLNTLDCGSLRTSTLDMWE
ncbi:hypothetical protein EJ06DRAFT_529985 [Trichodelitschia bisporula]|uniref:Uncharacterized protein n=1 Tax=Trichodelitschia bisporula TaxID=703511 RepID=A0A6G1HXV8_9PEZI|nr:hypothetical protein EJ06DRAFT_529985 [Trichodelitschia bisporula]